MTESATAKTGYVYTIRRPDLNKCYVGQGTLAGLPKRTLGPGGYQREILCADGVEPIIDIVETEIPAREELDAAERDWMRAMVEEGWILINALGPDDAFPNMPFHLLSKGGKKGGKRAMEIIAARRAADPAYDEYWCKEVAVIGGRAWAAKRLADPEFDARMRAVESAALLRGIETRRTKRATDPEWAKREQENARRGGLAGGPAGGKKTASIQRWCAGCEYGPTTPGGLGSHQKSSGHAGHLTEAPAATPVYKKDGE